MALPEHRAHARHKLWLTNGKLVSYFLSVVLSAGFDFFFLAFFVLVVLSAGLSVWANRLTVPIKKDRPSANVMSFFILRSP